MTTVDRVPRWSTLFLPLQETAYQLTPSVHFDCVTSWTLLKAPLKNKKQPIPTGCQYPKSRNPKPDLVDARRIPQNCQNPVPVLWKVIVLWTRLCLHFLVEDPFLLTLTYSKYIWFWENSRMTSDFLGIFDLPTQIRYFDTWAHLVKSDTAWPTYLPKNLTSYVNVPL